MLYVYIYSQAALSNIQFSTQVLKEYEDTMLNQSSKSWHLNIPPAVHTHTHMNYIRLHRKPACKYWP